MTEATAAVTPTAPTTEQTASTTSLVSGTTPTETTETAAVVEAPAYVPLTSADFKLPEGAVLQDSVRDEFLGVLNNKELTPAAQAQALVDLQAKVSKEASEAGSQAWTDMQTQWQTEVKNDPDVGGAKLDTNLAGIGKLIDTYGSNELRAVMDLTGAGNNVHVVKFLANVAKQLTEGAPVSGGTPTTTEESLASILYPTMKKGN